ncbi:hypothetical protein H7F37_13575 [Winogradskyella sp. PAMC22761]|nr:hypothetical protein H7F37_13575 [Winogradskyella sp. PAMC22761]
MMKILTTLLLLIFSLAFFSCNEEKTYEYCDEFSRYLIEVHDQDINNNVTYFLLPVNGCENCIELNLKLLKEKKYNIQLIIIGHTFNENRSLLIESLSDNYSNILQDDKYGISQYRIGFSKPLIVTLENGKCIYHLNISDFKVDEAKKYLEKNAIRNHVQVI